MLRIASYSQKALLEIENDFEINYEQRKQGSLQLFWDTKDIDKIAKDISILEKFNIQSKILDPEASGSRILDWILNFSKIEISFAILSISFVSQNS